MSHPIDPSKLLQQAEELAGIDAGPGRPNTTNHRRAVSAAYYALFHAINLKAARHVLPNVASDEEVWQATRWIEHADVRSVCRVVETCGASTKPIVGLPKGLSQREEPLWRVLSKPDSNGGRVANVSHSLRWVAVVFVSLHAARQSADYDHSAEFSKETVIGHVRVSGLALAYLDGQVGHPDFQRFFAWIFARASGLRR